MQSQKYAAMRNDGNDSSSDESNDVLDFRPFSPTNNKKMSERGTPEKVSTDLEYSEKRVAKRRLRNSTSVNEHDDRVVNVSMLDSRRRLSKRLSSRRRQSCSSEDDNGDVDAVTERASRKVKEYILPTGVTRSDHLVWSKEYADSQFRYYPSRICDPTEAVGLSYLPRSWDPSKQVLVEFLQYPSPSGFKKYVVKKDALIPYYGTGPAASVSKDKWCEKLSKKYQLQQQMEARRNSQRNLSKSDLQASILILEIILKTVLNEEHEFQQSLHDLKEVNSDDLEDPYSQNLNLPNSDTEDDDILPLIDDEMEKKKEPLRPGDIVTYSNPIFVAGDKRGIRTATVLSTDPRRTPIIILDSGDVLPSDTCIKRIRIKQNGTMYDHPGNYRQITRFIMRKQSLAGQSGAGAGFRKEAERVGRILERNMSTFSKNVTAKGLGPTYVFRNFKGISSSSRKVTNVVASNTLQENVRLKTPNSRFSDGRKSDSSMNEFAKQKQKKTQTKTTIDTLKQRYPGHAKEITRKLSDSCSDSDYNSSADVLGISPLPKKEDCVNQAPIEAVATSDVSSNAIANHNKLRSHTRTPQHKVSNSNDQFLRRSFNDSSDSDSSIDLELFNLPTENAASHSRNFDPLKGLRSNEKCSKTKSNAPEVKRVTPRHTFPELNIQKVAPRKRVIESENSSSDTSISSSNSECPSHCNDNRLTAKKTSTTDIHRCDSLRAHHSKSASKSSRTLKDQEVSTPSKRASPQSLSNAVQRKSTGGGFCLTLTKHNVKKQCIPSRKLTPEKPKVVQSKLSSSTRFKHVSLEDSTEDSSESDDSPVTDNRFQQSNDNSKATTHTSQSDSISQNSQPLKETSTASDKIRQTGPNDNFAQEQKSTMAKRRDGAVKVVVGKENRSMHAPTSQLSFDSCIPEDSNSSSSIDESDSCSSLQKKWGKGGDSDDSVGLANCETFDNKQETSEPKRLLSSKKQTPDRKSQSSGGFVDEAMSRNSSERKKTKIYGRRSKPSFSNWKNSRKKPIPVIVLPGKSFP